MYKENVGERLKTARIKRTMTQDEVAKELNISRTVLSRYENGKLEPNLETLARLIDLYEVSANWILGTGMKQ